jgi:hypothetical protein
MDFNDDFDPYAPPKTESYRKSHSAAITSGRDFSISDVMSRSWQILRSRMGMTIGVCFFGLVLANSFQVVAGVIQGPDEDVPLKPMAGLLYFIGAFFNIYINCGLLTFLVNLAAGRRAHVSDLFSGGPIVLKAIFASILMVLFVICVYFQFAILLALLLPLTGPAILVIAIPLGFIVYVTIIARLSQFLYLLIDREIGVIESLKTSSRVMEGRVLQFILLGVVIFIVNICGLLAFGVGLLITIPLSLLASAVYYLAVTGQPIADPFALQDNIADDFS